MLTISNSEVMNFKGAIRGMRNPMNSWNLSDSYEHDSDGFILGELDLVLAVKLRKAGSDHRKYLRQILVSVDVEAPVYWWKEYDTYKVATVANSTSTMHKIHSKVITMEDFSFEELTEESFLEAEQFVSYIESVRVKYMNEPDESPMKKTYWYNLIQLLPSSYNQLRTLSFNYETLINIYFARRNHKLREWHVFCDWIESLPYAPELICTK